MVMTDNDAVALIGQRVRILATTYDDTGNNPVSDGHSNTEAVGMVGKIIESSPTYGDVTVYVDEPTPTRNMHHIHVKRWEPETMETMTVKTTHNSTPQVGDKIKIVKTSYDSEMSVYAGREATVRGVYTNDIFVLVGDDTTGTTLFVEEWTDMPALDPNRKPVPGDLIRVTSVPGYTYEDDKGIGRVERDADGLSVVMHPVDPDRLRPYVTSVTGGRLYVDWEWPDATPAKAAIVVNAGDMFTDSAEQHITLGWKDGDLWRVAYPSGDSMVAYNETESGIVANIERGDWKPFNPDIQVSGIAYARLMRSALRTEKNRADNLKEITRTRDEYRAEISKIFEKLMEKAEYHGWCDEFDEFLDDNGWSEYNTRTRSFRVRVSAYVDIEACSFDEIDRDMVADAVSADRYVLEWDED